MNARDYLASLLRHKSNVPAEVRSYFERRAEQWAADDRARRTRVYQQAWLEEWFGTEPLISDQDLSEMLLDQGIGFVCECERAFCTLPPGKPRYARLARTGSHYICERCFVRTRAGAK